MVGKNGMPGRNVSVERLLEMEMMIGNTCFSKEGFNMFT